MTTEMVLARLRADQHSQQQAHLSDLLSSAIPLSSATIAAAVARVNPPHAFFDADEEETCDGCGRHEGPWTCPCITER
jgi:hypothetical protein